MFPESEQKNDGSQRDQLGEEQAQENSNTLSTNIDLPSISAPKGGGAISGIGEKFQANPVTGTGNMTIPIAISPGRNGFTPQLALSYDSGSANSEFGLGWTVGVPTIQRKTQKGLPQYDDENDSDIFILAGAEDLIPALREENGSWIKIERTDGDFLIRQYRPRIEGLFAKIELHHNQTTHISHWEVTTKDNITSVYGKRAEARISDPADQTKIFSWSLDFTYDEKGNIILYEYKRENNEEISSARLSEKNRLANAGSFTKNYLKSVNYTPNLPYDPNNASYFDTVDWHFQLVFDYGEHDIANPTPAENDSWLVRQDPFSSYRSGFEVRTYRLCRRVLLFHRFANDLGSEPYLVKSTNLNFDHNPVATRLISADYTCYQDGTTPQQYPPVSLAYSEASINPNIFQHGIEDLENLPEGVNGVNYRWTDLYGEGIPGVLIEDQNAWYFKQNLGDENYYKDLPASANPLPEARLGKIRPVSERPSLAGGQSIQDINADGTQDLVIYSNDIAGYYPQTTKNTWENFVPFDKVPVVDWTDPDLRRVDLNGDGFADLLITKDYCFRLYPALEEKGFDDPQETPMSFNEEDGPKIVFSDPDQSIYLADMSGDGLTDIVRIKNGSVCYWPNTGFGHFGSKVTFDNSPYFDHEDVFDQQRIRLADVDGSGPTDIIYISDSAVKYFPNHSGNELGNEILINEKLPTHRLSTISTLDLLGNGTQCLVWSSPVQGDHPPTLKFIDLMGGTKPYLLTEVNNNMGSTTRLKYAPSTKFYLRDQREGNPWITRLPFPVLVVERIEIFDEINRNRFVSTYSYHHGYYDGAEREFRGFGRVEQRDTESFTDFVGEGLFPPGFNATEEILHVPPIVTKSWFHTGFHPSFPKDANLTSETLGILAQYETEYWDGDAEAFTLNRQPDLVSGSFDLQREAARALKGTLLRQEVYSEDGSSVSQNPYVVSENNYDIQVVQPRASDRRDRDYASFLVTPAEVLSHQYERNPADPRVSHKLTLEVDEFGQVLKSAAVVYPRRTSIGQPQQDKTLVTTSEGVYINESENSSFYRLGVPVESKSFELTGPGNSAPFDGSQVSKEALLQDVQNASTISFETAPTSGWEKRLLEHSQILYYNELTTASLPLGEVASHALPFESYQLALTDGLLSSVLNEGGTTRIDATVLTEGAYLDRLSDGNQWVRSGQVSFDISNFYLPTTQTDPFGNQTFFAFDSYDLLLASTTDAVGNISQANYDYRILQPDLLTDPNGNRQAFSFDARGMVTAIAVMGKDGSNDGDTLADPTSTFSYDLFRWLNEQKPNTAFSRVRELHSNANSRYLESYAYSNGLGQVIMTKNLVAPGLAFAREPDGSLSRDTQNNLIEAVASPRWAGSGRTILDNKGNPIKQYEPYFSSTEEFESEAELVEYGVTPIVHYDPLGRAIRTELPDNTQTRVEFTPWRQANYDQNDTVLTSLWYTDRNSPDPNGTEPIDPNERAAWLAIRHADTPQVVHFDNLGRPFLTIDDNATDGQYLLTTELDIKGNPLRIIDAKGRVSFTYTYNVLNQPIKTTHIDNGTRYAISDVVGNPLRVFDSRQQQFRFTYDALLRPLGTYLTAGSSPEILVNYTVYGERRNNPQNRNLRGQPYLTYDSSGLTENFRFDFKGNPTRVQRQLALDYTQTPDWSALDSINNTNQLITAAEALLETEVFLNITSFDALNRPRTIRTPDNTRIFPRFDEGGLLWRINTRIRNQTPVVRFVDSITYNARGQRERILYGNDLVTNYTYDSQTFRLQRLLSTRNTGADILQDLNYFYDPVGNITTQRDNAQQTIFFDNQQVEPHGNYVYDALYRLIEAQGREKRNLSEAPGPGEIGIQPVPSGQNTAVRGYTEQYSYDELGNMLEIIHTSTRTQNSWNKYYHYDAGFTNNFLVSTSTDNIAPTLPDYTYDAHGNLEQMPHLASMSWDYADRLQSADLGGGSTVYFTYNSGGERVRKVRENTSGRRWERIYLGPYEIYRIVNGSGSLRFERQTLHISDDKSKVAIVDSLTVESGNPISDPTSVFRYQLNNHLESASLELDENADIISYEEFYPFGSTSYRAGRNNSEVNDKRYRYVGKEKDSETGLYYYGARYYASWLCRFVSVDPLKDTYPFYTSFQYTGNNPITFTDLDGQETTDNDKSNVKKNGQEQESKPVDFSNITFTETDESGNTLIQSFTRVGDQIEINNLAKDADGNVLFEESFFFDSAEFIQALEDFVNPPSANDLLAQSAEGVDLRHFELQSGSSEPSETFTFLLVGSNGETREYQVDGDLVRRFNSLPPKPRVPKEKVKTSTVPPKIEDRDFDDSIFEGAEAVVGSFETGIAQAIKEVIRSGEVISKGTKVLSRSVGALGIIIPLISAAAEIKETGRLKASTILGIGLAIGATIATVSAAPVVAAILLVVGIALAIKGDDIIDSFVPAVPLNKTFGF